MRGLVEASSLHKVRQTLAYRHQPGSFSEAGSVFDAELLKRSSPNWPGAPAVASRRASQLAGRADRGGWTELSALSKLPDLIQAGDQAAHALRA